MDKTITTTQDGQRMGELAAETGITADVQGYLTAMSDKERLAYTIAKEHLGTSFTVEKCVGFLKWKRAQTAPGSH